MTSSVNYISGFADMHKLVVSAVKVAEPNALILKTAASEFFPDLVKDDDFFIIDVESNTATKITPKAVKAQAEKDIKDGKSSGFVDLVQHLKLVESIEFKKGSTKQRECGATTLSALCRFLGMKVEDVSVMKQNKIIFRNAVIPDMSDLVKDGSKYYRLDVENNTAHIITPKVLKEEAEKDMKKGKYHTDAVQIALQFNLIADLKLVRDHKKAD